MKSSSLVGGHSSVGEHTESFFRTVHSADNLVRLSWLHSVTTQKNKMCIFITVKTSYLILTMTNHHNLWEKYRTALYCRLCSATGALFYLTTHITISLRPLHMMAGSAVLTATPPCPEPGSMHSVQQTAVDSGFPLSVFKESAGNVFLWLTDASHI
jgi:hypothetical protein